MPIKNKIRRSAGGAKIVTIVVISSLVVGFVLGIVLKSFLLGEKNILLQPQCASYEKALADARGRLAASGLLIRNDSKFLSGEIVKISDKEIFFTALLSNPLFPDDLKTRTAVITDKTEIILKKEKNFAEISKDIQDGNTAVGVLQEKMFSLQKIVYSCGAESTGNEDCLIAKDELEKISLEISKIREEKMNRTTFFTGKISDLKGKIKISVYADEDISEKSKFEAIKIELIGEADEFISANIVGSSTDSLNSIE